MPKISVVIPTKNREKLIRQAIQSVIDQTFRDWELLVVDDHSSQPKLTEEIVEEFNDQRIKYFILDDKFGHGIPAARNFGNMLASGEYIAVMDSDDVCYPDRLELQIKMAEKFDSDLVYADIDLWNPESDTAERRSGKYQAKDFDLKDFKKVDFIPNVTCLYKRKLGLDFPYNTFFRCAEDYDFLTRVASYGYKFSYIDKPLVKVRVHSDSTTTKDKYEFNYGDLVQYNRGWQSQKPDLENNLK